MLKINTAGCCAPKHTTGVKELTMQNKMTNDFPKKPRLAFLKIYLKNCCDSFS